MLEVFALNFFAIIDFFLIVHLSLFVFDLIYLTGLIAYQADFFRLEVHIFLFLHHER